MIAIGDTIVSEDIFKRKFVCDLNRCKGACCVMGESGAPLEDAELLILTEIFEKVKPFMNAEGISEIEKTGFYIKDTDGDNVTPLVDGNRHCAYAVFENDIARCAIENAYNAGEIDFPKPVSCHLYPVRITPHRGYDAVNVHEWKVCEPACKLGEELSVEVFQFLKNPLLRKFGQAWVSELEEVRKALQQCV